MVARTASEAGERWRMPAEGRVLLRRRALQKRERAERLALFRLAGLGREEARVRAELRLAQERPATHLLKSAVALGVASPVPLTITEALSESADLYVVRAIRLGELRAEGFNRRDSQQRLACLDDEWEAADEWLRDVQAELSQGEG